MFLFGDTFDHYVTADLSEKYTSVSSSPTIEAGIGDNSTAGLRCGLSTSGVKKTLSPTDATSFVVCVHGTRKDAPSLQGYLIYFANTTNNKQMGFGVNLDGTLFVARGGGTLTDWLHSTVLDNGITALTLDQKYWITFKGVISATAGSYELYLNGVLQCSGSGVNTAGSGVAEWSQVALGNRGCDMDYDTFMVFDQSGAINNDIPTKELRGDYRTVTADGNSSDATPSTGTDNFALVDESAPNNDTDYNTLAAPGSDTFTTQDAVVVGGEIWCYQTVISAKKTDSATCTVADVVRVGSTDYTGDDIPVTTSYGYLLTPHDDNPATTDVHITEAAFNAAEFGYERTA